MRSLPFAALLAAATLLAGCVSPYKIDVQQGNVVSQEMLEKLKPGMTKSQVRFALGTPLIADSFHPDRWDYFYSLKKGGDPAPPPRRRLRRNRPTPPPRCARRRGRCSLAARGLPHSRALPPRLLGVRDQGAVNLHPVVIPHRVVQAHGLTEDPDTVARKIDFRKAREDAAATDRLLDRGAGIERRLDRHRLRVRRRIPHPAPNPPPPSSQ